MFKRPDSVKGLNGGTITGIIILYEYCYKAHTYVAIGQLVRIKIILCRYELNGIFDLMLLLNSKPMSSH